MKTTKELEKLLCEETDVVKWFGGINQQAPKFLVFILLVNYKLL